MNQDPHAVLGVPRGVSEAALKRAFRSRARATHPDHGGDRVDFEAVVAAFEQLRAAACTVLERTPAGRAYASDVRPPVRFCAYDTPPARRPRPRPAAPDFAAVLADVLAGQAAA